MSNKLNGLTKNQAELLKIGLNYVVQSSDTNYLKLQLESIVKYHEDNERKENEKRSG